jgi:DNA polymerase
MRWSYDDDPKVYLWHRGYPWAKQSPVPHNLLHRIASGETVEAHNAMFEYLIWNIVLRREFPEFNIPLPAEQMLCSAAKASCLSLPRGLGQALRIIGAPDEFLKMESGTRLINRLCKPKPRKKNQVGIFWNEDETETRELWDYCGQDVVAERYLSKFCPEMTPREIEYWRMDWRMNERGILLDMVAVRAALKVIESETLRLNKEIFALTKGAVASGSKRKDFLKWANQYGQDLYVGFNLPNTRADTLSFALHGVPTKAGDDAKNAHKKEMDTKWAELGKHGLVLKRAIEICLEVNRTSNSKYKRMVQSVCPDGRLHDIMLYNGADRTGRWSGKGVQPHNFVRGYMAEMDDVWDDIIETGAGVSLFTDDDPLPSLAKACRGALVASKDKELYAADFNAIEARKLAWMANCISQLELFRSKPIVDAAKEQMKAGKLTPEQFALIEAKYDPYLSMAAAIYNRDDLTKKDKTERNLGKRAVLGLGYAMGWEKFQATVYAEEGIWLEDEFCKKVVLVYRKAKCPEVPALWKEANTAAIDAVLNPGEEFQAGGDEIGNGAVTYFMSDNGRFLHCRLPSGRCLAYLDPKVSKKTNWFFKAKNARGGDTKVTFPSRVGVPMHRVIWHAHKLAEKQGKTLTGDPPDHYETLHLSFVGRHIATKKWQRLGTHGGTLVENFDQASSRDLLAEAMLRVDNDPRFDLLLSIHDEVIAEAPVGTCTLREFETMMAETPIWARTMPIAAEGWIGPRLRK